MKIASQLLESILKLGLHQRGYETIWKILPRAESLLLTSSKNESTFTVFLSFIWLPQA